MAKLIGSISMATTSITRREGGESVDGRGGVMEGMREVREGGREERRKRGRGEMEGKREGVVGGGEGREGRRLRMQGMTEKTLCDIRVQ